MSLYNGLTGTRKPLERGDLYVKRTGNPTTVFRWGKPEKNSTAAKVIAAAQASQLSQAGMAAIGSDQELHQFLFKDEGSSPSQEPLDCAYVHKELLKKGVTLKLLWEEYAAKCCQAASHVCTVLQGVSRLCGHQPADHAHTA